MRSNNVCFCTFSFPHKPAKQLQPCLFRVHCYLEEKCRQSIFHCAMKWHICTTSTKNFPSAWHMWCQHQLKENSLSISPPVPLSLSSAQQQRQRQTMNSLVSWLLATITRLHHRWIYQLYFTFFPTPLNRSVGESFIVHRMLQIITTNKWTPQISEDSSIVHATSKSQFVNALRCMPNKKD